MLADKKDGAEEFAAGWILCPLPGSTEIPGGNTGHWLRYYAKQKATWCYHGGEKTDGSEPKYLAISLPGNCAAEEVTIR